jgi:triosephosphate isomerase (TIM)
MARPLIVGNWKMWGNHSQARQWIEQMGLAECDDLDWAVCPPFTLIAECVSRLGGECVGAQSVSQDHEVPHTGDISANMLSDLGAKWVIIGHSERRSLRSETDESVALQVENAQAAGLVPIVCVGETQIERETGAAEERVCQQLCKALKEADLGKELVIAYEPVWAIGTGLVASPEQVQAMHSLIRLELQGMGVGEGKARIIYGGSVKPDNAQTLFELADVDGALVGGASLDADQFKTIIQAARAATAE